MNEQHYHLTQIVSSLDPETHYASNHITESVGRFYHQIGRGSACEDAQRRAQSAARFYDGDAQRIGAGAWSVTAKELLVSFTPRVCTDASCRIGLGRATA